MGVSKLFDVLLKKIPDPSQELPIKTKILFNKVVHKIQWNSNTREPTTVTCKDESIYTADNVIVTVSLGVLKEK